MRYVKSTELNHKTLRENDLIQIGSREFLVKENHLKETKEKRDGIIFEELNLSRFEFCQQYYGYPPSYGCWPRSNDRDYKALTRVAKALMELYEKQVTN